METTANRKEELINNIVEKQNLKEVGLYNSNLCVWGRGLNSLNAAIESGEFVPFTKEQLVEFLNDNIELVCLDSFPVVENAGGFGGSSLSWKEEKQGNQFHNLYVNRVKDAIDRNEIVLVMYHNVKGTWLVDFKKQPTKVLVAMSHPLKKKQVDALAEKNITVELSETFVSEKCNQLSPHLTSAKIEKLAFMIVTEAISKGCKHIAMTGEPLLTFHVWTLAKRKGLSVLQSTTERKTVEVEQADGTHLKTQIFDHVQWRTI